MLQKNGLLKYKPKVVLVMLAGVYCNSCGCCCVIDCLDEALPGNLVDGEIEKKAESVKT